MPESQDDFDEVVLPPHYDDPNGPQRIHRIPKTLLAAEEHLERMLPSLVETNDGDWIYVTNEGEFELFKHDATAKDRAEISALEKGIPSEKFIVRRISKSEFEGPDNVTLTEKPPFMYTLTVLKEFLRGL